MKIGLNSEIFPREMSPTDAVRHAAAVGAQGYELVLQDKGARLSLDSEPTAFTELKRAADDVGVEIPSVCCSTHWTLPLTDPDPEVREAGIAALVRAMEIGSVLGARVLLVVPGVVKAEVTYATAYQRAAEGVARLAAHAQALGMRIGVENVWNKFLLSPLEMARFIDEIGSPAVGAYFDVGNVLTYGYPQHWIETLGQRIVAVHVKDYRNNVPGFGGFVHLLQGDVPWAAVRGGLDTVGYDGYVTAELSPYRFHPVEAALDTVRAMRLVFS